MRSRSSPIAPSNRPLGEPLAIVVQESEVGPARVREVGAQCYIRADTYDDVPRELEKLKSKVQIYNYVKIADPFGKRPERLAWIVDVETLNENLPRGIAYDNLKKYIESPELNLEKAFTSNSQAFVILKLQVLAELDDKGQPVELRTPTFVGDYVYHLDPQEALGYISRAAPASGEGIPIGYLYGAEAEGVEVRLPVESVWRHYGVFGVTGSGKTNTLLVLSRALSEAGVPVVAFAREFDLVRGDIRPGYTEVIDAEKLKIPADEVGVEVINYLLGANYRLTELMADLYERIRDMFREELSKLTGVEKEHANYYSIDAIIAALTTALEIYEERYEGGVRSYIEDKSIEKLPEVKTGRLEPGVAKMIISEIANRLSPSKGKVREDTIRGLRWRLFRVKRIFGDMLGIEWMYEGKPWDPAKLVEVVAEGNGGGRGGKKKLVGKIKVVDLTAFDDTSRVAVVFLLLSKLFELRERYVRQKAQGEQKPTGIPHGFAVVIDEVQVFAPQEEEVPTSHVLRKIAQMGRKRNIGLILASQFPTYVDPKVRRQLVTKIVHAIGTDSAKALDLQDVVSDEVIASLPYQEVGTALVVTSRDYLYLPVKVRVPKFEPAQ